VSPLVPYLKLVEVCPLPIIELPELGTSIKAMSIPVLFDKFGFLAPPALMEELKKLEVELPECDKFV
jgi:hypothetical protein